MGWDKFFQSLESASQEFKKGYDEGGSFFNSSGQTQKSSHSSDSSRASQHSRRTDDDFAQNRDGMNRKPSSFPHKTGVKLSVAKNTADSMTGVYVLRLNGTVMKCGRASYSQGVRWRFTQYYNLNYDNRARQGDCWSVNEQNRDSVVVSWQCCPEAACKELEYKLFVKYGKGPWAERAPASCDTDDWELLI